VEHQSLRKRKILVAATGQGAIALCDRFKSEFAEVTLITSSVVYAPAALIGRVASKSWAIEEASVSLQSRYEKNPKVSIIEGRIAKIDASKRIVFLEHSEVEIAYDFLVIGEDPAEGTKTDPHTLLQTIGRQRERSSSIHVFGNRMSGLEVASGLAKSRRVFFRFPGKEPFPEIEDTPLKKLKFAARKNGILLQSTEAPKSVEDMDPVALEFYPPKIPLYLLALDDAIDSYGNLRLRPDFRLRAHTRIYVLSELVEMEDGTGRPIRNTAAAQFEQGRYLAKVLKGRIEGVKAYQDDSPSFVLRNYGEFAHIGFMKSVGLGKKFRHRWQGLLIDAFLHKLPEFTRIWGPWTGFLKWCRYYSE
jgi:hypothetical protein